jgi:hypothetical protein
MNEIKYYVVKTKSGKYRVHVETPSGKKGDAAKIFGDASMWKDYNTEQEAQDVIDSFESNTPSINEPTLSENMRRFKTKNLL